MTWLIKFKSGRMKEKIAKSLQAHSTYAFGKQVFLSLVAAIIFATLLLPVAKAATISTFVERGKNVSVYPFRAVLVDFTRNNATTFAVYYNRYLIKNVTITRSMTWSYGGYTISIRVNSISPVAYGVTGANVTISVIKTQTTTHSPYLPFYWREYAWREVHFW